MRLERRARLPFLENFPVDIHLRIYLEREKYTAELWVSGMKPQRFPLGVTPERVKELNQELQDAIEDVARQWQRTGRPREPLTALATAGKAAFRQIFSEGIARAAIRNAFRLLPQKRGATMEISSESFILPWELLYDGTVADPIVPTAFWGMRFIISRTLIQDNRPGDMVSPVLGVIPPRVGLIAYTELEAVMHQEIPALEQLQQEKLIALCSLRPLDPIQRHQAFEELGRFLRQKLQIVHFACHADTDGIPGRAYVRVSDHFDLTIQDFYARGFTITAHPFVILNACRTGTVNPLSTANWAHLFWEYGARGVLATEFTVPDWFAAPFIDRVYRALLAGIPIGEALWQVRWEVWKKQRNLLALAYVLYSPIAIRVSVKESLEWKTKPSGLSSPVNHSARAAARRNSSNS